MRSTWSLVAWAAVACFTTYFCMYGYRKAISAATFDGITVAGISFKSALIIAQVLGYMTSKFIGIKFISELNKAKRARYILLFIGSAHLCLLGLALVPLPFNILFLFLNGMCLGLIWGLVFSYIEGRRFTDLLALILSINFIFSSGVAKSLGRACIDYWKVPELYMPFVVGILFIPLLLLAVWMLNRIPPPEADEVKSRGLRVALNGSERMKLFRVFWIGLSAIIAVNLMLTILRDVKDNFAVEILRTLKPNFNASIFTKMETIAAIAVFCLLIALAAIRNHFKSIMVHHVSIAVGLSIVILSAWLLQQGGPDPVFLLVLYTVGLYVGYNTLQCLFLDRFISAFGIRANIGFFFYLMDSIGYLGSCFVILYKELFSTSADWFQYFLQVSYLLGAIGLINVCISILLLQETQKSFTSHTSLKFLMQIKHYDLIVIGAGVLGSFHAYHACKKRLSVLLLEKDSRPMEASVRNFGQIVPSGMSQGRWQYYGIRSMEIYTELQQQADISVRNSGSVYIASNETESALLHELNDRNKKNGYPCSLLSAKECLGILPALHKSYCTYGLSFPQEITVEPDKMIHSLLAYLQEQLQLHYKPGTLVIGCTSASGTCVVKDSTGSTYTSDQVIICTGRDFKSLYPNLFYESDIEVSKLQMMKTVPLNGFTLKGAVLTGLSIRRYESFRECPSYSSLQAGQVEERFTKWGIHILFKQAADGGIIIGDSHEYADARHADSLGYEIRQEINEIILEEARRILHLPDWSIARYWNGYYAQSKSHDLYKKEIAPGIHIITAIGGKGMTAGPALAEESINQLFNL
ncbi:MAG: TIGR03364 family FAD-dependent oxidoreductase [Chitinophagaceae bacterium]